MAKVDSGIEINNSKTNNKKKCKQMVFINLSFHVMTVIDEISFEHFSLSTQLSLLSPVSVTLPQ